MSLTRQLITEADARVLAAGSFQIGCAFVRRWADWRHVGSKEIDCWRRDGLGGCADDRLRDRGRGR